MLENFGKNNVKIAHRFYEASFAKDMYEMLNVLENGDFNTPIIEELQRINSILNGVRKTGKNVKIVNLFSIMCGQIKIKA